MELGRQRAQSIYDAQGRSAADVCDEPYDSPSRAACGVLSHRGRAGAVAVRAEQRRTDVQLERGTATLVCVCATAHFLGKRPASEGGPCQAPYRNAMRCSCIIRC